MTMAMKKWNWFKNDADNSNERMASGFGMTPWAAATVPSLTQFRRDVEQLYGNAFRNLGLPFMNAVPQLRNMMQSQFQPHVDIVSTQNTHIITVEAPGLDEKDIRLDISPDGVLTISGEKRQETENRNKDYEHLECSYGFFQRSFNLPEDVDQDNIEANFRNGVLTITCPRTESIQSLHKQIPINGRSSREGTRQGSGENARSGAENRSHEQGRNAVANMPPKKAA